MGDENQSQEAEKTETNVSTPDGTEVTTTQTTEAGPSEQAEQTD